MLGTPACCVVLLRNIQAHQQLGGPLIFPASTGGVPPDYEEDAAQTRSE